MWWGNSSVGLTFIRELPLRYIESPASKILRLDSSAFDNLTTFSAHRELLA